MFPNVSGDYSGWSGLRRDDGRESGNQGWTAVKIDSNPLEEWERQKAILASLGEYADSVDHRQAENAASRGREAACKG